MRIAVLILFAAGLGIFAGGAVGQPKDGDLVFTVNRITPTTIALVAYVSPGSSGPLTTLASVARMGGGQLGHIRMASNNTDFVAGNIDSSNASNRNLIRVTSTGLLTSVCRAGLPGDPTDFELDHDGTWVVTMDGRNQILGGVADSGGAIVTFATVAGNPLSALAIVRDPNDSAYCLGWAPFGGGWALARTGRSGGCTTVATGWPGFLTGVDVHARTGDYLVPTFQAGLPGFLKAVLRVSKSGKTTVVHSIRAGGLPDCWFGGRILQDNCCWLNSAGLLKLDLSSNTVVTMMPSPSACCHMEVYGYRRLVCYQPPASPTTVTINVQSRHPLVAGTSYILAASFARRPGFKMPNGEWLDLDTTGPLFWLTAQDLLPQTFVNFRGALDSKGHNTKPILVRIPAGLPKLHDKAVFVAGVIFDPKSKNQVIQVTNSHWFVLP